MTQTGFEVTGLLIKTAVFYGLRSLPSTEMRFLSPLASDGSEAGVPSAKMAAPRERRSAATRRPRWETSESFSVFALHRKQKLSVITAAMSWVQVVACRSNEDIFDEDADEMYPVQKEWSNTMKKRLKEGYRDGVEAGKELALQEGFNQGYRQGAELMVTCGQFRGTLNALLSWCHLNGHDSALREINNLLEVVGKHEEDLLKCLNSIQLQPNVGDILDSVQDMDLSHIAPAGTEYSEVNAEKYENVVRSSENCCRNNDEDGSLQFDCNREKLFTDPDKSTLAWVKKQTVWLVEQLGLSLDILHHIQQLEH